MATLEPRNEFEVPIFRVEEENESDPLHPKPLGIYQTLDDANNAVRRRGNQLKEEYTRRNVFISWEHKIVAGHEFCQIHEKGGLWIKFSIKRLVLKGAGSEGRHTWND
jgi:hypothetical protein